MTTYIIKKIGNGFLLVTGDETASYYATSLELCKALRALMDEEAK